MIDLLRERLQSYAATDAHREQQALREILQEVALYGLWRAGFFDQAAFQGGTALRILHGLRRFSEDLDFISRTPAPDFRWEPYLATMADVLADFGIRCELHDRSRMTRAVREAMIKDDSLGRQLDLSFYRGDSGKKLRVKLEMDTRPPAGSGFDFQYLDFPLDFEVCAQDLPSNFALKLHALLCRPYVKGRDWFDFAWYAAGRVAPNLPHLEAALAQVGPWAQQPPRVDQQWLKAALMVRIAEIDWLQAARDVAPFVSAPDQASLGLWSERFFANKVSKLFPEEP